MATTKTLTPTNQTITIDAFQGEKPDHRHVADAETKLADAVNALNSQIGSMSDNITVHAMSGGGSGNFTLQADTLFFVFAINGNNVPFIDSVRIAANGTVYTSTLFGTTYLSYTHSNGILTITNNASSYTRFFVLSSRKLKAST